MLAKINEVKAEADKTGLKINIDKTKEESLEDVSTFCYIGSFLTLTAGSADDERNRIKAGKH